ncbi:hypothetical protein BDF19DRAFT_443289 [Syncephalis fuscata]|nr:hypothetical protein BDF19DRAFT_443289 [Syncephalis fuscata]
MRFLNPSHEPTSLVLSRVLFIVMGVIGLSLIMSREISHFVEQKNVYQVEYYTEPLAMPAILFRSIVAPKLMAIYNIAVTSNSGDRIYSIAEVSELIKPIKWNSNVTDSSYSIQDWKILKNSQVSPSLNNSILYMAMLDPKISHTFVPKTQNNPERVRMNGNNITELHMRFEIRIPLIDTVITKQPSDFQAEIFVIDNPDLLNSTKHGKPFDLATVDSGSRFIMKSGTRTKIGFFQSYTEKDNQIERMYDVGVYEQWGTNSTAVEFTIIPRNKPSANRDSFIVRKEFAQRPVSLFQIIGAIGGAISLFIIIFTILFGQGRLRPWGIIQQYFMRNKMLNVLPQSMISIKSYYDPRFNHELATDMKGLHMPNSEQYSTAFRSSKSTVNTYRQKPLNNDISQRIPSTLANDEQSYLSTADTRGSEICELKAMIVAQKAQMETQKISMEAQMATQIKQLVVMSNRFATLEDDPGINNSTTVPNSFVLDDTCLPNLSMTQHSKSPAFTSEMSLLQTRMASMEAFQCRLKTFYLSSDLFKDA